MLYRLIVLSGPLKGSRITVDRTPSVIGRDPSCEIHLDDEEVALRHAMVQHRDDGLVIWDLGTMNRILVNKREVRQAHLRHGDEVEIGRTRFLVQALLQSEVEREEVKPAQIGPEESPRRRWLLLVLLAVSALFFLRYRERRPSPAPERAQITNAPPPVVQPVITTVPVPTPVLPPEVVEELRGVRETLSTLKETLAELSTPAQPPPPAPEPPKPPPSYKGWLSVESVEQTKLPVLESSDEVRLFRMRLRAAQGVEIDPKDVRVEIQLFVREAETERVFPARVQVEIGPLDFEGVKLADGSSAYATLNCRIPGGAGRLGNYYGFRLRVYYRDVLQAELYRPRTLAAEIGEAPRTGG